MNPSLTTIRDLVNAGLLAAGTKVEVKWASGGGGRKEGHIDADGYIATEHGRYPTPSRFLSAYSGAGSTSGWSRVFLLDHSVADEVRTQKKKTGRRRGAPGSRGALLHS